jgi:hypothetical protein
MILIFNNCNDSTKEHENQKDSIKNMFDFIIEKDL